ncbi:hypothetical protein ACP4OV_031384 [Aristida adscensionis]
MERADTTGSAGEQGRPPAAAEFAGGNNDGRGAPVFWTPREQELRAQVRALQARERELRASLAKEELTCGVMMFSFFALLALS